ncbi:serine hydrolase [Erythrobacter sp.]|uniref:serine hydrolase n=1 Tax=Erythrobacter sp. TaxID=1042 RepID=UPI0025FFD0F9|nr:serine hydrolase [Erythrobacter sp.]
MAQEPAEAAAPLTQTPLEIRSQQVVGVINGSVAPEDVFSDSFLAAIPAAQLKGLSASLTAQFGAAVEVSLLAPREGTRAALEIRFERGLAKGGIAIDPAADNRVTELVFNTVDSLAIEGDTPEQIAADLSALPGSVNAWFAPLDGGTPAISIGADTPLALGSTFKLYVLAALAEDVKAGKRRWGDVVPLTQKSYPSGKLQDWPAGAPLTLHTLASVMISISDNTATDQLIKEVGEDRILKLMADSGHANPGANNPFLNTRALFQLKGGDAARLSAYQAGDAEARSAILATLDTQPVTLQEVNAAFAAGPKAIDVEWFASPADLAKLFAHMRETADPEAFEIMAINPSATPAIVNAWDYIGFKGGSEPGVLNLTWLLRDKAGAWHVLTLGWNNPAASVDQGAFEAIAQRILLLPR